jgi:hypothetical protein
MIAASKKPRAHAATLRALLAVAALALVIQPVIAAPVMLPLSGQVFEPGNEQGFIQVQRGGARGGGGGARGGGARAGGGGARAGGGGARAVGGGRQNFNSNNFNRDVRTNNVSNRNVNRNTSVNRNVNVNGGGGCCNSYNSGPGWGGVAVGVAAGAAVGAIANSAASTQYAPPPAYPPGYVAPPPY